MKFTRAITRTPAPSLAQGITSANLGPVNFQNALQQHAFYVQALERLGLTVTVLPADEAYPDSTFVEDVALIFGDLSIVTNPGAASRNGETKGIRPALREHFEHLATIHPPGTLDGGDVMWTESRVYVGLSSRTNRAGADQLEKHLENAGLELIVVEMAEMLHLKTGVNYLDQKNLLVAGEFTEAPIWNEFNRIVVSPDEAYAANSVCINGTVLVPAGFRQTALAIKQLGYPVVTVDTSEFQKLDGGLSCLSLRF